jgi:FkbM family methyltransferase
MFQAIKNCYRCRQLTRRGIIPELALPTFTAGDRSGVWTVCSDLLGPDSVAYSFGVGDNLAWDLAVVDCFGLTLHAFDPIPASVAWVARQVLPPRMLFHRTGLAGHDGTLSFALPRRGSRFNFRPVSQPSWPRLRMVQAPVARLATHMRQLSHDHLDVLKMDIEGGEYAAIDDLLASRIPVRQLLVEFHHHFAGVGIGHTERAVQALGQAGYRIFHISGRGLELGFLHDAEDSRARKWQGVDHGQYAEARSTPLPERMPWTSSAESASASGPSRKARLAGRRARWLNRGGCHPRSRPFEESIYLLSQSKSATSARHGRNAKAGTPGSVNA